MPIHTSPHRWVLETQHTAYAFGLNSAGLLTHHYWGARLPRLADYPIPADPAGFASTDGFDHFIPEEFPGYAGTNLQFAGPAYAQNPVGRLLTKGMNTVLGQSARAGSWPTLYAATQPDVRGGDYIGPDGWFEMRGHPRKVDPNSAACDDTNARALWEASEELTGVEYPWPVAAGR